MKTIILLSLVISTCFSKTVFSQEKHALLKSKLVNGQTHLPINYAHVYNESQRYGAITDSLGLFQMHANPGDTIIFIALGYFGKHYTVQSEDFDTIFSIQLTQRRYEIEEVIFEFPGTYKHFKQALLEVDVDKDQPMRELPEHNKYKTPELLDTNIIKSAGFMIMHPISGLYYRFSKEEKSKRKVWHAQQQELKQSRVDEKFNRQIVSEITGLKDNNLTQFIGYCNFSFNYLFETSPYDIIVAIENKYIEYLNCCYDKTE